MCDAAFDGDLVMINAVLSLDPSVLGKSTKEGETLLTNAVAGFTFNPDASPEVLTVLLQQVQTVWFLAEKQIWKPMFTTERRMRKTRLKRLIRISTSNF